MIVDGYVDEPTCLGVPPYISTYPRYISGAIWTHSPQTEIIYQTIDQVRMDLTQARNIWAKSDMILLIAGMIVPGKYLGGTPISVREAKAFFSDIQLDDIPRILVGPWARFGCGLQGGRLALSSEILSPPFTHIVQGDAEVVLGQMAQDRWDMTSIDLDATRVSAAEIEDYTLRGTHIITQFPGYASGHLICEIESYRGCPRFFTGGCSFCTEPLYGRPQVRQPEDIIREVQMLYEAGVQAFRIGRQADLFTFGSEEMGDEEFPLPNPDVIERLFSGIRKVAPDLQVLHIDNVNPGTIAHHPEESRRIVKTIIKYHTPGDVAAFGIESVDPEVMKRNNLKVSEDEALTAIRILNEVGGTRFDWGLPHLLPGINLLYGLPGERKQTMEYNLSFLEKLVEESLMVRRINIRQVIGFPGTGIDQGKTRGLKRSQFIRHKQEIRDKIDLVMIQRVVPLGTVIRSAFVEQERGNSYLLRQLGTYPILCQMPGGAEQTRLFQDVFVIDHGPRSVTVLPFPFHVRSGSLSQWKAIPGLGAKRAARAKAAINLSNIDDLESALETELPDWFERTLRFS
ncbi:MAG: radical SAM protein [Candidatus Thorarchaeota archaeon]